MTATRRRTYRSVTRDHFSYQVRVCFTRLYGKDPLKLYGPVQWDKLMREHFVWDMTAIDAARKIHEEVKV